MTVCFFLHNFSILGETFETAILKLGPILFKQIQSTSFNVSFRAICGLIGTMTWFLHKFINKNEYFFLLLK